MDNSCSAARSKAPVQRSGKRVVYGQARKHLVFAFTQSVHVGDEDNHNQKKNGQEDQDVISEGFHGGR